MENRGSDSNWRKAFDGAEATPSDAVWSAIESELIAAENVSMKKRIVLYQRLAAASVVFAILVASFSLYDRRDTGSALTNRGQLSDRGPDKKGGQTDEVKNKVKEEKKNADINNTSESVTPEDAGNESANSSTTDLLASAANHPRADQAKANERASDLKSSAGIKQLSENQSVHERDRAELRDPSLHDKQINVSSSGVQAPGFNVTSTSAEELTLDSKLAFIPPFTKSFKESLADAGAPAKSDSVESPLKNKQTEAVVLPWDTEETIIAGKKDPDRESLWASVGASGGVYNPGASSSAASTANVAMNLLGANGSKTAMAASSEKKSPAGLAYSYGVALAGKIFPRWILQGGVTYITQQSGSSETPFLSGPPAVSSGVTNYAAAANLDASGNYNFTNTLKYVSVPVQAGYLVIDRKLGFMVSAGVSPNIFVWNSLKDGSGKEYAAGISDETPYKKLAWSGLMSTELSYRITRQYRFALVPGVRYALGSTTKAGGDHPYVMDIGFRVRYNFTQR